VGPFQQWGPERLLRPLMLRTASDNASRAF